jgi:hypothetical protein
VQDEADIGADGKQQRDAACRRGPHRREFSIKELALQQERYAAWQRGELHGLAMCLAVKGAARTAHAAACTDQVPPTLPACIPCCSQPAWHSEAYAHVPCLPPPPLLCLLVSCCRSGGRPARVAGVPSGLGGRPCVCVRHRQPPARQVGSVSLSRGALLKGGARLR